jgi:hypothetical protein
MKHSLKTFPQDHSGSVSIYTVWKEDFEAELRAKLAGSLEWISARDILKEILGEGE